MKFEYKIDREIWPPFSGRAFRIEALTKYSYNGEMSCEEIFVFTIDSHFEHRISIRNTENAHNSGYEFYYISCTSEVMENQKRGTCILSSKGIASIKFVAEMQDYNDKGDLVSFENGILIETIENKIILISAYQFHFINLFSNEAQTRIQNIVKHSKISETIDF